MRGVRTYKSSKPPEPLNLTDEEIDVLANVLHQVGRIPDWRRRIDVMAQAVKIAICETGNPRYHDVRKVCGITMKDGSYDYAG